MATGGNGSDEIVNHKCCLCDKKNITREADKYCVECQDYYCTPCTDLHKTFPGVMGMHQFLDSSNFDRSTAGIHTALPSFPVERCSVHKAKLLEMYCRDHNDVVCGTCVALSHRTCKDVHSVPDDVDILYKKSAADETKKMLMAIIKNMEELKESKAHIITELDKYKNKANASIKDLRKEIEAVLDRLENESRRQVQEEYQKMKTRLEDEIGEIMKYISDLKQSYDNLSKSTGNKAQEFVSVVNSEKNICSVKVAEMHLNKIVNVEITFDADSGIKAILHDLNLFGQVSIAASAKPRTTLYTVKNIQRINVKHSSDERRCSVQGSCFTEKGHLLLADSTNKKLKRVDISTMSILDYVDLKASPTAVCQISMQEVCVCLDNNTIQFVTLGDMMATTKTLQLEHGCFGLAYKNGKLFISDDNQSIYIYKMNGTRLLKITSDKAGNPIFRQTQHIGLGNMRDKLLVADYHKGLITLDLQGKYESLFTDPDLVNLRGVCTDTRGNIFVCGSGQSNIVQINENANTKLGVLGKVGHSLSACFDPQHDKLVVTLFNTDHIEVIELE